MTIELTTATATQLRGIRNELGLSNCVSVKDHGAIGDGKRIAAMSKSSSGTTVLTGAPSGTFSAGDVGKIAWATDYNGAAVIGLGTIATVNSSTSVTLSGANGGATYSGTVYLYFATQNDTTAIQAAWTAAKAAGVPMFVPAGMYFFNRQLAGVNADNTANFGVVGEGSVHTVLVAMPDFASTSSVGNGLFINITGCGYNVVSGLRFDGAFKDLSQSGKYGIQLDNQATTYRTLTTSTWVDLTVENLRGFTASIRIDGAINATIDGLFSYNGGYIGISFNGVTGVVRNVWSSNGSGFGVHIVGGSKILFIGCLIDEHSYYTTSITGSHVTFRDCIIYGGASLYCMEISGSTVLLDKTDVLPYALHPNSSGITVDGTSTLTAQSSTVTGTGSGKCVTGAGMYIDNGGNTLAGTVDVANLKGVTFGYPISLATKTPASAAAAGVAGQIAWDASYIYVCTATNTWKRAAIATW